MSIIDKWTEKDLSAEARKQTLATAYEVDDILCDISSVIGAGSCPLLVGEPGVGKTAVVHEWVRRLDDRKTFLPFGGRRVIQVSSARQALALDQRYKVVQDMQLFVQAVSRAARKYVVFITDLHVTYDLDLEHQIGQLISAMPGSVVAEALTPHIDKLFEHDGDLQRQFTTIHIPEPSAKKTLRIARAWAADHSRKTGRAIDDGAIEQAFYLSHRFLSRTRQPTKTLALVRETLSRAGEATSISGRDVIARFCEVHRTRIPQQSLNFFNLLAY